jgi:hypothetical protein
MTLFSEVIDPHVGAGKGHNGPVRRSVDGVGIS